MRNGLNALPVAALVTVLSAAPAAWAQNETPVRPDGAGATTTTGQLTDASFVAQATQSNLAELKLSMLASERSRNEQVRAFAKLMLADHGKVGAQLKQLAGARGLAVPTQLTPKHDAALKALGEQQGKQFDAGYIEQMQRDHDAAVALFEQAAETEQLDAALRGFARRTLPKLKAHQQRARELGSATANLQPVSAAGRSSRRIHHVW